MTIAQRVGEIAHQQVINARALEFAHVMRWLALGRGQSANSIGLATNARATARIIEGLKALVSAGTASDAGWAAPLAFQEQADGFLESLRNVGIFDSCLPYCKNVPLNTQVLVTTFGATASSIEQGSAKVVSQLQLANVALTLRKSAAILVANDELLRHSSGKAARLLLDELTVGVVAETDAEFLRAISNGISPVASAGNTAAGIGQDFGNLFAGINTGVRSKIFFVLSPGAMKHVAAQIASTGERAFPSVNYNGGEYAGATLMASDGVPAGQIIGFDAAQIAGSTGTVEPDASNQAAIQADTAPDSPPAGTTPIISFWQSNQTGLRAHRWFGCERLRSTAVSVINNVNYSANSPA